LQGDLFVHQYAFPPSYFTGITCEAGIVYPSGAPGFTPDFSGVHVAPVFRVMFCRWSFVLLSFIFWPLCWLYFYDLRPLITFLVSSNFPYIIHLYLSPIVLFSSFFVLYLLPWLFWIISWLYYYTLFYSHHYYYNFGLFHDYIIIHCFIHIIITIILDYFMIILLYIALFTSLLL
jgi:hypothetical protein